MNNEKELTLIMCESNGVFGKWAAYTYKSDGLDDETFILDGFTGHGDTPLKAAANLLAMAAMECKKRLK